MDDQKKIPEEDFMDYKDPFFDELDKIKQAATGDVFQPIHEHNELRTLLERIARDATRALSLLSGAPLTERPGGAGARLDSRPISTVEQGTIVEGIFDGSGMIGSDGKQYSMSANYASKSKLVEGDSLKLTIMPGGNFVYKQTRALERRRIMGILSYDDTARQYCVCAEGNSWKILTASVTYYKGVPGDEVVILIPKEGLSTWGAVEHIIKKF